MKTAQHQGIAGHPCAPAIEIYISAIDLADEFDSIPYIVRRGHNDRLRRGHHDSRPDGHFASGNQRRAGGQETNCDF